MSPECLWFLDLAINQPLQDGEVWSNPVKGGQGVASSL